MKKFLEIIKLWKILCSSSLILFIIVGVIVFTSISCNREEATRTTEVEQVMQIKHRLFYGECLGYCDTEIILDSQKVKYIQRGWTEKEKLPEKDSSFIIPLDLMNKVYNSFNIDSVFSLDSVYQPLDEIDNSYITIEMTTSLRSKIIKFNTQKYLPPLDSLNKLFQLIRRDL